MKKLFIYIILLLITLGISYGQEKLDILVIGKWKNKTLTEVVYENKDFKVASNLNSLGKGLGDSTLISDHYYIFKPDKTGESIFINNGNERKTPFLWSIEYYEKNINYKEYYLKIVSNNYNRTSIQRFFFSWIYGTELYAVFSNNIDTNITRFDLWEKVEYY